MLRTSIPVFNRLADRIATMLVIDCREHLGELSPARRAICLQFRSDPILFLVSDYMSSDLISAGASGKEQQLLSSKRIDR